MVVDKPLLEVTKTPSGLEYSIHGALPLLSCMLPPPSGACAVCVTVALKPARPHPLQPVRGGTVTRLSPSSRASATKACSSCPPARRVAAVLWGPRRQPELRLTPPLHCVVFLPPQKASVDLVNVGPHVEREKDALLEAFVAFAGRACELLGAQGHWADYIDPCSGLPMLHRSGTGVYGEVDALVTLLRYTTVNAGCCKVALHPQWGSAVYPASLMTKAPLQDAMQALQQAAAEMAAAAAKKN